MGASGEGVSWLGMPVLLIVAVSVMLLLFIGFILFLARLRKRMVQASESVMKEFQGDNVVCYDKFANFFGLKSAGVGQIRGNGILILTKDELFFKRLMPDMELRISRDRIISIDFPKFFLGKSIFRPLLKVEFKTGSGETDEVAWYSRNIEEFKRELAVQNKEG